MGVEKGSLCSRRLHDLHLRNRNALFLCDVGLTKHFLSCRSRTQFKIWTQLCRGVIDRVEVLKLNDKEAAIVKLLRNNPFLTQQEMADQLNMSRPALANLISGLMKRGIIAGRAYILAKENEIVCIGGANVDRKFHMKENAQLGTSNPTADVCCSRWSCSQYRR